MEDDEDGEDDISFEIGQDTSISDDLELPSINEEEEDDDVEVEENEDEYNDDYPLDMGLNNVSGLDG